MKKGLTVTILTAAAAIVAVLGAYVLYGQLTQRAEADRLAQQAPTQEQTELPLAPDFTVYDKDGNAVKLSDFRGKPTIVNFWASWCGPCKNEMPDFEAVYAEYGSSINFLMVNLTDGMQETKESANAFLAETNYTFPVYYDLDKNAATTYGVYSVPVTYFFDAEGHGVTYANGRLNLGTLLKGVEMILPAQQ